MVEKRKKDEEKGKKEERKEKRIKTGKRGGNKKEG